MIQATSAILSKDNIKLLDQLKIDYAPLHNSKANELAFTTDNHRKREFEIKFMSDKTYRISTRFVGYKNAMKSIGENVIKTNDPDGRRRSFYVTAKDINAVNEILKQMLTVGYNPNPKTEQI